MNYEQFIASKMQSTPCAGLDAGEIPAQMFPHQRDLTRWALRKGRAAIFADTGLGKTLMELAWAARVAREGRVLILAPLAVSSQIVAEAARWGLPAAYARNDEARHEVTVTNYEMLHAFDPAEFHGVVLDESSILKAFDGKTRTEIISAFRDTPFRLAATATPAPNDFTELGNHAEFLGVKTRQEMLAEFFVHDGGSTQDWRIKGHARVAFWRWVATWGAVIRSPADLGHDATAYALPPLHMHEHVIEMDDHDVRATGLLFAVDARTLQEQRAVRRGTMTKRVAAVAELVERTKGPVVVWCELNDEGDALEAAIPGAVQVAGKDGNDDKAERLGGFAEGRYRVMITKASVAGFGLNWQHCATQVFVGASHSYEQTYQAIRRCWRFGQTRPVNVHVFRADTERAVVENYRRKEADARRMSEIMAAEALPSVQAEVIGHTVKEWNDYNPTHEMIVPDWIGREAAE